MNSYLLAQLTLQSGSFFEGFSTDQRLVLIILAMTFFVVVAIVLASIGITAWSAIRGRQIDADLKRDMLDRGMTAEDIERVLSSQYVHWWGGWYYKK